jgi:uncharacterized protein YdeI (YjbR/CyaY-like superfamily)
MNARFFARAADFRRWLKRHHGDQTELWVGFHKRATGKPSLTWSESVDEALCFGWVDGIRKRIDDQSYAIRFTPRQATSIWSALNLRKMAALTAAGRVAPAGLAAFDRRNQARSASYSYEQRRSAKLDPEAEKSFRANRKAWHDFRGRPPGYRQTAIYWIVSAKRAATRARRLDQLIACSAAARPLPLLDRKPK